MNSKIAILIICFSIFSCIHKSQRTVAEQPEDQIVNENLRPHEDRETETIVTSAITEMIDYTPLNLKIRAGYSMEKDELNGCVIYLQGLGDSIRNHRPYFKFLNTAGYRIIYFDYMGQGGSEGDMSDTTIQVQLPINATKEMRRKYAVDKYRDIPEMADFVWSKYQSVTNHRGQNCLQSKKLVIGWSTGGLAAYRMAHEHRADAVILLAPGIHPKLMVGAAAGFSNWIKIFSNDIITEKSLTRNNFEHELNPHLDPIKPTSPLQVKRFAGNLIGVARDAQQWIIKDTINPPHHVEGLVFLSGAEDTYVDRDKTIETLEKNAKDFKYFSYDGALHELDNELPKVSDDIYQKSVEFLNQASSR